MVRYSWIEGGTFSSEVLIVIFGILFLAFASFVSFILIFFYVFKRRNGGKNKPVIIATTCFLICLFLVSMIIFSTVDRALPGQLEGLNMSPDRRFIGSLKENIPSIFERNKIPDPFYRVDMSLGYYSCPLIYPYRIYSKYFYENVFVSSNLNNSDHQFDKLLEGINRFDIYRHFLIAEMRKGTASRFVLLNLWNEHIEGFQTFKDLNHRLIELGMVDDIHFMNIHDYENLISNETN